MIVNESELHVLLGIDQTSITDEFSIILQQLHAEAESLVRAEIAYDPEQKAHTEYYPRHNHAGGMALRGNDGTWDANTGYATLNRSYGYSDNIAFRQTLCLRHLPVREITLVRVGSGGNFGSGDASTWTEGVDFYPQWEAENYCEGGFLHAASSWPLTPGSIVVRYIAGYSPAELSGRVTNAIAAEDLSRGVYSSVEANAAGLKRAVVLTVAHALHTQDAIKQNSTSGTFSGGNTFQSERLQDYSYTRPNDGSSKQLSGLLGPIPDEALQALAPYVNYGIKYS